jgi:hypothetical protein
MILKWHLIYLFLNNVIATGFTLYCFFQAFINCWTTIALLLYDGANWLNQVTAASRRLCRMTRWNQSSLTRQQARKHKRRRLRSPMIYVRAKHHNVTKL